MISILGREKQKDYEFKANLKKLSQKKKRLRGETVGCKE